MPGDPLVQELVGALREARGLLQDLRGFNPLIEQNRSDGLAACTRALSRAEAALDEGSGGGWRPIETAPKDGTWFLACATMPGWGATRIVRFAYPDDRLPIHGEGNVWPSPPTHWQPLPPPPPLPEGETT